MIAQWNGRMIPNPVTARTVRTCSLVLAVSWIITAALSAAEPVVLYRGSGSGSDDSVTYFHVRGLHPDERVMVNIFALDKYGAEIALPNSDAFSVADAMGCARFALPLDFLEEEALDSLDLFARARVFRREQIHSNRVFLRQAKALYLLVRGIQSNPTTRIVRFEPWTQELRGITAANGRSIAFDVAGSDQSIFFEGAGGAFLHRYRDDDLRAVASPTGPNERILDLVATNDGSGLLLLTGEPTGSGQTLLRLWLMDTATSEWFHRSPEQQIPAALVEAALVTGSQDDRLFVVQQTREFGQIREYTLSDGPEAGAWIPTSSDPWNDRLISVEAIGPYLVSLTATRDGQSGKLSVFDLETRKAQFEEVLPAPPRRLDLLNHGREHLGLVLLESGVLLGVSLDQSRLRFSREIAGATEIAVDDEFPFGYALVPGSADGGGARIVKLELDGSGAQVLTPMASHRCHKLRLIADRGRAFLVALDSDATAPLDDAILCWELDPATGEALQADPLPIAQPSLNGTVLRARVR
jgi:hypothetical protein